MHSVCSKLNQPKLITDKDDFSKIFKTNVATVQKPTSNCFDLFLHDPNNGINCLTNKSCHVFVNCKVAYQIFGELKYIGKMEKGILTGNYLRTILSNVMRSKIKLHSITIWCDKTINAV